jgi:hypothetical protein
MAANMACRTAVAQESPKRATGAGGSTAREVFGNTFRNHDPSPTFSPRMKLLTEGVMGKGILLWLIGVPIPVILLLALFWH